MLVIVIPTKNRRMLLQRAFESVVSQSRADWRAVIIDDGSTDSTYEYSNSIQDSRVQIIRNEKSKGVNAARNAGFRTLREGEWAIPLDDDDYFLPGAFDTIARTIAEVPSDVSILQFPTIIETRNEVYEGGGVAFAKGQNHIEPTYEEIMTSFDFGGRGESRPAFKWTLFPKYLFNEKVNGFEGEWWQLVFRDGIRIRFVNTAAIVHIDWRHEGEHLSDTAARENPVSFAHAHRRILRDHAAFFANHPALLRERSAVGFKVAARAYNPFFMAYFAYQWTLASARIALSRAS